MLDIARFAEIQLQTIDFAHPEHQVVFAAIEQMARDRQPVDLVTVTNFLENSNQLEEGGGISYIATLIRDTPSSKNVAAYAGIVQSRSTARRATEVANTLIEDARDPGAVDVAVKALMGLTVRQQTHSACLREIIPEVLDEIDAIDTGKVAPGLPTGLTKLDKALGGLSKGNLYVVGARPAMGKTVLGGGFLLANRDVPTGMMSMEQPKRQIVRRMAGTLASVPVSNLRRGQLSNDDWSRLDQAFSVLSAIPCYINDQPAPPIDALVRQARKWKYDHDIQLLVVDYIQRISGIGQGQGNDQRRHEQVAYAALQLKEIARELDIPVVALSQVSREVERRDDKRPTMMDFKDSAAIEAEADVMLTLYRDEVYYDEPKYKGLAEIGVIKQRHGPLGKILCRFVGEFTRFEDLDARSEPDLFQE